jgi:hypothetical protein
VEFLASYLNVNICHTLFIVGTAGALDYNLICSCAFIWIVEEWAAFRVESRVSLCFLLAMQSLHNILEILALLFRYIFEPELLLLLELLISILLALLELFVFLLLVSFAYDSLLTRE